MEPVALQLSRYVDADALPGRAIPAVGPLGWSEAKSEATEVFFLGWQVSLEAPSGAQNHYFNLDFTIKMWRY